MGEGRVEVVGEPGLTVVESMKETVDRVGKYQTDYVGRTCLCDTRTTNCGGCLEATFVVPRLSCPFISRLVVLCLWGNTP